LRRQPAHVAMFTVPAAGHVHPSLEIVRELVARGHRVTYTVTEEFAPAVAAVGGEPVLHTTTLPTGDEDRGFPEDDIVASITMFLNEAVHVLPQMASAYQDDRPDLVLYDVFGYPGLRLAHRWGVSAVQISPSFVPWKGQEEELAPMIEAIRKDPRGIEYQRRFAAWLAEEGITTEPYEWARRPERSVVTIVKALQPHADLVDESVHTFVGPCLGDRSHQDGWRRPADARKVLLISLGSAFNNVPGFYRACFEAFGGLDGWHVVLSTGRRTDVSALGPAPANFELHPWIPQLDVLREADAFVTHAGMGGTMEGLVCGVPMVAVPQAVDQFLNAASIASLGVGRHLPKEEATPDGLREAVLSVAADPAVAGRLGELREEISAAGGARRAADVIESFLVLD
jgi:macrolide glycosyltransferase